MNAALTELRQIRESGIRTSIRVIDLWLKEIGPKQKKLGQEKWVILEQVFIAALDVGNIGVAKTCLETLRERFPRSTRVDRLLGMFFEFEKRYDKARDIYTKITEDDPANTLARKRLIAILKAQGHVTEAIAELNKYLNKFMADMEAWNELSHLYLSQGDYKHAAFCVEEMILANPHNHQLHQRLAEIKYSEGGTDNLEISRAYFAHACTLNPANLRALFGLLLVCGTLAGGGTEFVNNVKVTSNFASAGTNSKAKDENQRLALWASKRIAEIYAAAGVDSPLTRAPRNLKNEKFHAIGNSTTCIRERGATSACDGLADRLETLSTASSPLPPPGSDSLKKHQ